MDVWTWKKGSISSRRWLLRNFQSFLLSSILAISCVPSCWRCCIWIEVSPCISPYLVDERSFLVAGSSTNFSWQLIWKNRIISVFVCVVYIVWPLTLYHPSHFSPICSTVRSARIPRQTPVIALCPVTWHRRSVRKLKAIESRKTLESEWLGQLLPTKLPPFHTVYSNKIHDTSHKHGTLSKYHPMNRVGCTSHNPFKTHPVHWWDHQESLRRTRPHKLSKDDPDQNFVIVWRS